MSCYKIQQETNNFCIYHGSHEYVGGLTSEEAEDMLSFLEAEFEQARAIVSFSEIRGSFLFGSNRKFSSQFMKKNTNDISLFSANKSTSALCREPIRA